MEFKVGDILIGIKVKGSYNSYTVTKEGIKVKVVGIIKNHSWNDISVKVLNPVDDIEINTEFEVESEYFKLVKENNMFKKGDRVRRIHSDYLRTKVGGIYTIDQVRDYLGSDLELEGLGGHGYDRNRFELAETDLKVPTLGYPVEFKNGKFKVGCQTIDYQDAQKIADFIKLQKEPEKFVVISGQRYERNSSTYLVSEVASELFNLIDLNKGNRYYCSQSLKSLSASMERDEGFELV